MNLDEKKEETKYLALSCIFGAFLGDALVSYCYFSSASKNNCKIIFEGTNIFSQPPGIFTDDSEMAISFTFAIFDLPNIKDLNLNYIYFYYHYWIKSRPFDCGNTIRSAFRFVNNEYDLERINFDLYKKFISMYNDNSLANGFLMRISPLVIWFYYLYNKEINEIIKGNIKEKFYDMYVKIKSESIKDNQLTHPNYENNLASGFFIFMSLSSIVKNNPKEIIKQIEFILENGEEFQKDRKSKMYKAKLMNEIKKIKDENFNKFDYFKDVVYSCGYYFHALRMTIHYLYHFDDYKDENYCTKYRLIMNEICNFGGDTDTNCAIVGTVIGPLIGYFNFGVEDFNILIKLKKRHRIQFSSFIMYDYVKFLEKNVEDIENGKYVEDKKPRYNTLRWFLEILYGVKDDK
jgi:ADP-ribosylglycohydrolase